MSTRLAFRGIRLRKKTSLDTTLRRHLLVTTLRRVSAICDFFSTMATGSKCKTCRQLRRREKEECRTAGHCLEKVAKGELFFAAMIATGLSVQKEAEREVFAKKEAAKNNNFLGGKHTTLVSLAAHLFRMIAILPYFFELNLPNSPLLVPYHSHATVLLHGSSNVNDSILFWIT